MKFRMLIVAVLAGALLVDAGASSAATPQQTIKTLRAQLTAAKKTVAKQKRQIASLTIQRDLYDGNWQTVKASAAATQASLTTVTADRDTQAANLATANGTIAALQSAVALAAQGGTAAVIAGGPNAMWIAVQTIWQSFPLMPSSSYCGYDKDTSTLGGTGLNIAHFTFSNYTNCG